VKERVRKAEKHKDFLKKKLGEGKEIKCPWPISHSTFYPFPKGFSRCSFWKNIRLLLKPSDKVFAHGLSTENASRQYFRSLCPDPSWRWEKSEVHAEVAGFLELVADNRGLLYQVFHRFLWYTFLSTCLYTKPLIGLEYEGE
jgi:hypothetical protein